MRKNNFIRMTSAVKKQLNLRIKKALERLYHTKLGQAAFNVFLQNTRGRFARGILLKCLANSDSSDIFMFPRIPLQSHSTGRHALIIMPFLGLDAASVVVESMSAALKSLGYVVHALHYNDSPWQPTSPYWDHCYYLNVQSGRFGVTRYKDSNDRKDCEFSYDRIDEWSGDELPQFVASLGAIFDFDLCICNYVFFSRALEYLPRETLRILYTHDIFANRNERISAAGGSPQGWHFSTTPMEESIALRRADVVVAIQKEEAKYFSEHVGRDRVDVLPYMPPRRFQEPPASQSPFVIGYIGSRHHPNVDAIRGFIEVFDFSCGAELRIAGPVCTDLRPLNLPRQVVLLGNVEDLSVFYAACHIFINPDMLRSGLKVKCIEALSFGKPLVCTESASAGIGMSASFHTAGTILDVARYVKQTAVDGTFYQEVMTESRRVFDLFLEEHSTQKTMIRYAAMAVAKRNGGSRDQAVKMVSAMP